MVAVIVAQVAVPLVALLASDPPTRLGFQMYSATGTLEITVQDRHGDEVEVDVRDVLGTSPRPEIDWTKRLPEALCEVPEAHRVTVTKDEASRTVTC